MRQILQGIKRDIGYLFRSSSKSYYTLINLQIRHKSRAQNFLESLCVKMSSSLKTTPSAEKQQNEADSSKVDQVVKKAQGNINSSKKKTNPKRPNNTAPLSDFLNLGNVSENHEAKTTSLKAKPQKSTKANTEINVATKKESTNRHPIASKSHQTPKKTSKAVSKEALEKGFPDFLLSAQSATKIKEENNTFENLENEVENDLCDDNTYMNKKRDKKHRNGGKHGTKLPEIAFEEYMKFDDCSEGLKQGDLLKGSLRINIRNFNEAFITSEDGGRDIYIDGIAARNRALPGDIVAVKLLPKEEWKIKIQQGNEKLVQDSLKKINEDDLTKTAKVVFILEKKHPRVAAGFLNVYKNNAFGFSLMSPVDSRLPRLMIPLNECPEIFKTRPKDLETTLFIAQISNWNLKMAFASGKLMRSLGEAGHIEPETEALLISNDIDSSPFKTKVIDCLPNGQTWTISQEEVDKRLDLRKECIFTIDPATARDLDDALSCKRIDDDLFEVGVHIADVSHFIDQGNELDKEAMSRATSVYLAQRVIPMLPSVLCEQLCSLNPGVDRLAYSVIWNLRSDGTIVKEWFGRTVIRSCVKLSYNHAQQLIESSDNNALNNEEFPEIHGGFALQKIRQIVKVLYNVSVNLRKRRYDSGALRLDQPKLAFALDDESGLPNGFSVYEYKDSNRLIEEFMLLANMAVGRKIYEEHPDRAILRCHPPPHAAMMDDVKKICQQHNIPFDISDSASISRSLEAISGFESDVRDRIGPALTLLCTKPFQNAKYFCTGSLDNEEAYRHYALNVPIYTHFTSPIRRYPDVLVHRFLTAALDTSFKVDGDIKQLQVIAEHCNDKKWAAKKASEQSSLLFFAVYLLECGAICEKGVVVGILDRSVDVLCTRLGTVQRVYCDKLPLYKHQFNLVDLKPELTLYWQDDASKTTEEKIEAITKRFERKWSEPKSVSSVEVEEEIPEDVIAQKLSIFSSVDVVLSVDRKTPTKINAVIKSPFATDTPDLQL